MKRINIWAFTIATFGLMACAQNKSQPAKAAQQEQNIKQKKDKRNNKAKFNRQKNF